MKRIWQALMVALGVAVSLPAAADAMAGMDMGAKAEKIAHGMGVITAIDAKQGTITLAHQAIKEMNWPAMTMAFRVSDPKLLTGRSVGEKVTFQLKGNESSPTVTAIQLAK